MDLAGQCTSGLAPAELGWSRHDSPWPGSARQDCSGQVYASRGLPCPGAARPGLARLAKACHGLPCRGSTRRAPAWPGTAPLSGHGVSPRVAAWLVRAWLGRSGLGFPGRGEASLDRSWRGAARPGSARQGKAPLADIRQSESLAQQAQSIADRYQAVRRLHRSVAITYVSDYRRAA